MEYPICPCCGAGADEYEAAAKGDGLDESDMIEETCDDCRGSCPPQPAVEHALVALWTTRASHLSPGAERRMLERCAQELRDQLALSTTARARR